VPKIVADMHVPPALRRWTARFALALLIAIAIAYLPGQVLRRDPRAAKLDVQIEQLTAEARELAARNAGMRRQIAALRTDVGAIEDRARADLGMVYPDEVVLRLPPEEEAPAPGDVEPDPQMQVPADRTQIHVPGGGVQAGKPAPQRAP
jgi:cell division protein FtsB